MHQADQCQKWESEYTVKAKTTRRKKVDFGKSYKKAITIAK